MFAFAEHVNERTRGLRGLGAFRVNERARYLRGMGQDEFGAPSPGVQLFSTITPASGASDVGTSIVSLPSGDYALQPGDTTELSQSGGQLIVFQAPGSSAAASKTPTYVTPSGQVQAPATSSVTAPLLSQQWMAASMIPGVKNSFLVLGVAGVFLISALKKKKKR
jgi:hypothetical protein